MPGPTPTEHVDGRLACFSEVAFFPLIPGSSVMLLSLRVQQKSRSKDESQLVGIIDKIPCFVAFGKPGSTLKLMKLFIEAAEAFKQS